MKMQSNSSIYSLQSSRLDQQAVFTTSAQKHHGRHDFPSSWLCIDWNQKPKKESWPLWEWKNHKKECTPAAASSQKKLTCRHGVFPWPFFSASQSSKTVCCDASIRLIYATKGISNNKSRMTEIFWISISAINKLNLWIWNRTARTRKLEIPVHWHN